MIQRAKQNRELLNISRKQKKNRRKTTYIKGKSSSREELERINQNKNARELEEERHLLSVKILLGSIVIIVLLVVLVGRVIVGG